MWRTQQYKMEVVVCYPEIVWFLRPSSLAFHLRTREASAFLQDLHVPYHLYNHTTVACNNMQPPGLQPWASIKHQPSSGMSHSYSFLTTSFITCLEEGAQFLKGFRGCMDWTPITDRAITIWKEDGDTESSSGFAQGWPCLHPNPAHSFPAAWLPLLWD